MERKWWSSKTKLNIKEGTYDGSLIGVIVLGVLVVGCIVACMWLTKGIVAIPGVAAALLSYLGKGTEPTMTE